MIRASLVALALASVVEQGLSQEPWWPTPAPAPELFVGTLVNAESFERYYDPFRSLSLYVADRRASGTILGRVGVGSRGTATGSQVEGEWYPILGAGSYLYTGYALGLNAPYPRHRAGLEYFTALPAAFELSLGLRAYVFRDRRTVSVATGSVARYLGNAWISLRPYLSFGRPRASLAVVATGRYYTGGRDEFFFVRAGAGFTPDERSTLTAGGFPNTEVFTLHSQSIGGGGQWFGWVGWLIIAEATLARQEVGFMRGSYVWNPSVTVGLRASLR